jgi:hypothetical protein
MSFSASCSSSASHGYEKFDNFSAANVVMQRNGLIGCCSGSSGGGEYRKQQKSKRPKSAFGPFFQSSFAIAPQTPPSTSYLINSNSTLSLNQQQHHTHNPFYKYISSKNEKYYLKNSKDSFKSTSALAINPSPNNNSIINKPSNLYIKKNLKCASSVNNNNNIFLINSTCNNSSTSSGNCAGGAFPVEFKQHQENVHKNRFFRHRYIKKEIFFQISLRTCFRLSNLT